MFQNIRRAAYIAVTAWLLAQPASAGAPPAPVLTVSTTAGPILIELHPDAAPDAVAQIRRLAASGGFDGVRFDYARPHVELRTAQPDGAVPLAHEIDAHALGLDRREIASRAEAMDAVQRYLIPAYRKALHHGQLSAELQSWLTQWFDSYDPRFLIGTNYLDLYAALGHAFHDDRPSRPVTRGAVALVPDGMNQASARLSIALSDMPQRTGKWMVVGRVVSGLDVARRISVATPERAAHTKPSDYRPLEPVVIHRLREHLSPDLQQGESS